MGKIKVSFFGNFMTTVDNERVTFPFGMVEALFYYLVVNKFATRDHLANLLWSEMGDQLAKKNLRNALYTLKKLFVDVELFTFNGLSSVSLNPDAQIESDYDAFIQNEDDIEVYKGEFLHGNTVKDADVFERWMYEVRDECNYLYYNRLCHKLNECKESKDYLQLENICRMIIRIDEYDEKGYVELMNCYKEQQKYSNAIVVYNELADLLLKELEVEPNKDTKRVYNEILDLMNERDKIKTSQKFFFGRDKETRLLKKNYHSFNECKSHTSFLIRGDMGVGKTRLKEYFVNEISDEVVNIVEANCYKFEENYVLRPWKSMLVKILKIIKAEHIELSQTMLDVLGNIAPEFESQRHEILQLPRLATETTQIYELEDVILELLRSLSNRKKMILIFEDIHWMDATSMRLLNSLLVKEELKNCFFFLTMRNEMNHELEKFLVYVNHYANVDVLELTPFNKNEVMRFITRALPEKKISNEMIQKIYHETEGNAFFLTEYVQTIMSNKTNNIMSARMMDVLKSRFIDLNQNERKILEITSLFYDEVSISILGKLLDLDELEIIEIAEALVDKGLLKEITYQSDICYTFVHQKLREFQYLQVFNGKKKILHYRIGKLLEQNLRHNLSDLDIYYKLIYHFEKAGNDTHVLKYRIKSMNMFLNFIHERFPVIQFDEEAFSKLYLGEEDTEQNLVKLVQLFEKVKEEYPLNDELNSFKMHVCYLDGRYKIRTGKYESGLKNIDEAIQLAITEKRTDFILKGYEQKIIYALQTRNVKIMGQELAKVLKFIDDSTEKCIVGVWLRYQGVHEYLQKNYEEAEDLFRKSILIHTHDKGTYEKYRLKIAACYNNIGEIRVEQGKHKEALHYFEKAISICKEKNLWISVSLFKTNAGEAYYYVKNFTKAKEYLQNALLIYNKLEFNLSQPIAEKYMCLLLIKEKEYMQALTYLKAADIHAQILKSPSELESIAEAKKIILTEMKSNQALHNVFHKYLQDFDHPDFDNRKGKQQDKSPLVS
ncbi:AAA family ATPase [Bacillus sp. Bva_UNVM-123]|uniref:AAA family ATPase n=1 Tax=Bacillus sp. Bva_UNVM-123 TaxID=2829798 RepID=UPI00391EEA5C